jgi:PAS domain S-box-containing protein
MICSIDADGKLRSVNIGGERLLGGSKEALVGKKLTQLSISEQFEETQECLKVSIGSRQAQTFELRLRSQDGSAIDTLWSCFWSQAHQLLFCVVHNISEQKKAERLREDFTEMISQDLRQPLIEIHDSLHTIASGNVGEVSATVATDVAVADRNVNRLVELVNDLLDFQRLSTGISPLDMGSYDLVEVSKDAAILVQSLALEKGINLILPSGSMVLQCDGKKLMQALLNLISNAIKYSPDRGTVTVELVNTGTSVQVLVKDEGPGVPDDFKQAVFEPFQQSPSAKGKVGTGLGLAICKSIAEVHGGSIRVFDGADGGSIFCLEISTVRVLAFNS